MVKETENGQRDRNTDSLADSTRFPFCRQFTGKCFIFKTVDLLYSIL